MLGFFLACICFVITIPLKSLILGLKITTKKGSSLYDHLKLSKVGNAIQQLNNEGDTKPQSTEERKQRIKQKAKKALILSLKMLVIFLRVLGCIFSMLGAFSFLLIGIIAIVLIASLGGIIALLSDENSDIMGTKGNNNAQAVATEESSSSLTHSSSQKQVYTDNSSWVACCSTMLDWYIANVPTYQKNLPPKKGSGERAYYPCDLLGGLKAGDDCSGFLGACLYYAGFAPKGAVPGDGSATYKNGNAILRQWFNEYHYEDYLNQTYVPRPGDIVATNKAKAKTPNGHTHHVEVIAEITNGQIYAYGWGSVRKNNPRGTGFKDIGTYLSDYDTYWSLKDNVVPPSYTEGKKVEAVD